jgi:type IV pilus biogenesis protein CpaD/CtpE
MKESAKGAAIVFYERVVAKECDATYVDMLYNNSNINQPAFGCATSSNMMKQVVDKRQIMDPMLLGKPDAAKAAQVQRNYMKNSALSGEGTDAESTSQLKSSSN